MSSLTLAALMLQVAAPPSTAAALPPTDWGALPQLHLRRPAATNDALSAYVEAEVAAGRCNSAIAAPGGRTLRVDLAVLGTPDGQVRRVVPAAIQCPTVEQYAAGLIVRMTRNNVDPRGATADTWYRTSIVFSWAE